MFNSKAERFLKTVDEEERLKLEAFVLEGMNEEAFFGEDVENWTVEEVKSLLKEVTRCTQETG